MYSRDDAKLRAEKLRGILKDLGLNISHSNALETISRQNGYKDWNTCAATLDKRATLLPPPKGWYQFNMTYENYECGSDPAITRGGTHPAVIRFKNNGAERKIYSFDMSQSFSAKDFRGKRVCMAADLRAEDVQGYVTIFMRAFDKHEKDVCFDNLGDRGDGRPNGPISGTTDWCPRSIVLNMPETAERILLGFYLLGQGTAWMSDFSFGVVDQSIPVTSTSTGLNPRPSTLSVA